MPRTSIRRIAAPVDPAAMRDHAGEASRLLGRLAHETRLLVLCHLCEGELSVGELNARIPASQSALSQHLAILRADGLVATRREAQTIYYRIADARAAKLLAVVHDLYCRPRRARRR